MTRDESEATTTDETSTQTIFLVEDDEDIRDFLVRLIDLVTPYKVVSVTTAVQALEVISSIKPGLFLLDYRLPFINGLDLSDRLHAIEGLETVPTLLISATSPSVQARQQRHITFLKKPLEISALLAAIEKLLPQVERKS